MFIDSLEPRRLLAAVTATVFNDVDGNGLRGASEAAIAGVKVFVDVNSNGKLDAGEPSGVTSATGSVAIAGLKAGSYKIRQVVPAGQVATTPAGGFVPVTLAADSSKATALFGDAKPVSIRGNVFADGNADAKQNTFEVGIPNRMIFLDANGNGILDAGEQSVASDGNGNYAFSNLKPGTYNVREVIPASFKEPAAQVHVFKLTLTAGQTASGKNFANDPLRPVSAFGNWDSPNGVQFDFVLTLSYSGASNTFNSQIKWTEVAAPPQSAAFKNIGKSATEFGNGSFNPGELLLSFSGTSVSDPSIISPDVYHLLLGSDGVTLTGITGSGVMFGQFTKFS